MDWRSSIEIARAVTASREARGMRGPLIDKRDADEWRIRRRISRRWSKRARMEWRQKWPAWSAMSSAARRAADSLRATAEAAEGLRGLFR